MDDILRKIGVASKAMAATALAMKMAGEHAEAAAVAYEDLAAECKTLNLEYSNYETIAQLFRGICAQNKDMEFNDLIKMCMMLSEVCA